MTDLPSFDGGQVLRESESGYPPRSVAADPDAPVLWVGGQEPPLTEEAARVDDTWFRPDA